MFADNDAFVLPTHITDSGLVDGDGHSVMTTNVEAGRDAAFEKVYERTSLRLTVGT